MTMVDQLCLRCNASYSKAPALWLCWVICGTIGDCLLLYCPLSSNKVLNNNNENKVNLDRQHVGFIQVIVFSF